MTGKFAGAGAEVAPKLAVAGAGRGARPFDGRDGDGDGRITLAEVEVAGSACFDRMDANDREIGGTRQAANARMERRLAKRFESLNANGNAAVPCGLAGKAAGRFGHIDADRAGTPARAGVAGRIRRGG